MTSNDFLLGYTALFMIGVFVAVLGLLRLRRENERLRDIIASYEARDRRTEAASGPPDPPGTVS